MGFPADNPDGWNGFALLVDDVERYIGNAVNFSLAALDASVPHFFRLAVSSHTAVFQTSRSELDILSSSNRTERVETLRTPPRYGLMVHGWTPSQVLRDLWGRLCCYFIDSSGTLVAIMKIAHP